jgi:hypothetical protein
MNMEHSWFARQSRRLVWKGLLDRMRLMQSVTFMRKVRPGNGLYRRTLKMNSICLHGDAESGQEHCIVPGQNTML